VLPKKYVLGEQEKNKLEMFQKTLESTISDPSVGVDHIEFIIR